MSKAEAWLKRAFDLAVGIALVLVLAPVIIAILILVRWRLGSPVFFRDERLGLHGRPFVLLKFRTMTDARNERNLLLPDKRRLTPLGRFLRATSLDELPELLNVIRGDMRLVGPRPWLSRYRDRYTPEQMQRHDVAPGITGWAAVNGRNALAWQDRIRLDLWYIEHQSFWLDLKIVLMTLWRVLRREGVNQPGRATTEEFAPGHDHLVLADRRAAVGDSGESEP